MTRPDPIITKLTTLKETTAIIAFSSLQGKPHPPKGVEEQDGEGTERNSHKAVIDVLPSQAPI
jgi:hypothetical protein